MYNRNVVNGMKYINLGEAPMLPLIDIYIYTYHIDYTMRLPTTAGRPSWIVPELQECNDGGCPKAWVPVIG
jgi:hypothetical protein